MIASRFGQRRWRWGRLRSWSRVPRPFECRMQNEDDKNNIITITMTCRVDEKHGAKPGREEGSSLS